MVHFDTAREVLDQFWVFEAVILWLTIVLPCWRQFLHVVMSTIFAHLKSQDSFSSTLSNYAVPLINPSNLGIDYIHSLELCFWTSLPFNCDCLCQCSPAFNLLCVCLCRFEFCNFVHLCSPNCLFCTGPFSHSHVFDLPAPPPHVSPPPTSQSASGNHWSEFIAQLIVGVNMLINVFTVTALQHIMHTFPMVQRF